MPEPGREAAADAAADELCAVLDGFDAVRAQDGATLTVKREQIDRWARQIGRALLVLDASTPARETP